MEVTERQVPRRAGRLPYLPGLDGLRALAVLSVLLYHADVAWLPGGFLGVEVFFVISGYLITSLLLAEWRDTGTIDLRAFWLRRARRLLPALGVLLVLSAAFIAVFLRGELGDLRGDVAAALTYSTNWYLIFSDQSYFAQFGRPPVLQHLWSLAVEEQFYLLWPLLFAAGMRALGRRTLLRLVLGGVVASTLLMAVLYPGAGNDPSRIYYGTDTRAAGLLLGVALAFVWAPWRLRPRVDRGARTVLEIAGLASLAVLTWALFVVDEYGAFLYRGGFLLVAATTAALIAVVVHPGTSITARLLGLEPLRWVGLRSYGLYLYHWPIYMVTRPGVDVPIDGLPLLVFRLSLTVIVAELSYRYVEVPVRQGALAHRLAAIRRSRGNGRTRLVARTAWAAVGATAVLGVLAVAIVQAPESAPPSYLAIGNAAALDESQAGRPVDVLASPSTTTMAQPARQAPAAPVVPAATDRVVAVGDSVMLGAASALVDAFDTNALVDAVVGRQVSDGIAVLRARRDAGELTGTVVVQFGNNGTFTAAQFEEMMEVLADVPRVVVLNVRVPRRWEGQVNDVVARGVARYPNAVLADWYSASAGRADLFWDDATHLRPEGAAAYAALVRQHALGG